MLLCHVNLIEYLSVLILCLLFIAEDLKLNAQVFHWPENIMNILDLNQGRLAALR